MFISSALKLNTGFSSKGQALLSVFQAVLVFGPFRLKLPDAGGWWGGGGGG